MLGKTRFPAVRAGAPYQLALAPFGFYWFQLERLDTSATIKG
jgi:maltose alpha-D-glucosyltransferase/alpha-amylase